MTFDSEENFENHIRDLLESEIVMPHGGFTILKNRGIADIIICRESPEAIFFIEVKYAKKEDGIVVSGGIQSEILFGRPHYINDHFMWLIGRDKHDGQYWLLDSSELTEHVSCANNISLDIFCCGGLTREELVNRLREWMR